LYAPATVRRQCVCAAISLRVAPFGLPSVVGVWNTEAPYATALRITFVYISLALARLQPYADTASLVSAKFWVDSFPLTLCICSVKVSFLSSHTPKNRVDSCGSISLTPRRTFSLIGCLARVKWISSLFSGTNCIPLELAHSLHICHACPSLCRFVCASLAKLRRFVSSAKPTIRRPAIDPRFSYKDAI
jgi:hypothetical protein